MRIEHAAIWVMELEKMKDFYIEYFSGKSNERYMNSKTGFQSYFISFGDGARLELMYNSNDARTFGNASSNFGYAHLAFSVGDKEIVDELTERLRRNGYQVVSEPRTTGDGYYESCVLDPEGNRIEITE